MLKTSLNFLNASIMGIGGVCVDWNSYFDWNGVRLLHSDWHMSLMVHWHGSVDWHLDWVWDWPFDRIWNVFRNFVGLGNWHLDWVGHWSINVHGHWTVDGHFHGVGSGLLHHIWNWFLNMDSVGLGNMDGVWSVNWDLDWVGDSLLNWVGLGNWDLDFHWVWNVFLDGVGLRNWDLDLIWNVFLHWVGLRDEHFDGVRSVYGDMDWVGDLLLNWVGLGHMHWNLDVFLDMDWHMFHDFIRLGHWNAHLIRHMSLHLHGDLLLDSVWDWDSLQDGHSALGVNLAAQNEWPRVSSIVTTFLIRATAFLFVGFLDHSGRLMELGLLVDELLLVISDGLLHLLQMHLLELLGMSGVELGRHLAIVSNYASVVSSTDSMASAQVTDVQTIDAVAVAQIQKTAFVQLLLEWHRLRFARLLRLLFGFAGVHSSQEENDTDNDLGELRELGVNVSFSLIEQSGEKGEFNLSSK